MGELVKAVGLKNPTEEEYQEKKRRLLASINERTENLVGEMIYCRKCYQPKLCDWAEKRWIVRCNCKCDVDAWERERNRMNRPMHAREIRAGDWNPFD